MTEKKRAQVSTIDKSISMLENKSLFDRAWVEVEDIDSRIKETLTIDRQTKVPFEIMRVINGGIQLGGLFITPAEQYLLYDNLSGRKRWIKTKTIRQLLHDGVHHTKVRDTVNGYCLLAYVDKQLLLDNADADKCPD